VRSKVQRLIDLLCKSPGSDDCGCDDCAEKRRAWKRDLMALAVSLLAELD
jgi:hypothetical protein